MFDTDTAKGVLTVIGAVSTLLGFAKSVQLWVWKRKLTWNDALRTAEKLLADIQKDDWNPDLVIGLGRSGGIWGGWLAGNLGSLPLGLIDDRYGQGAGGLEVSFPSGSEVLLALRREHPERTRVLIVEGATSSGKTLDAFLTFFAPELQGWDVRLAVLYQSALSTANVHFVGERLERWPEKFPWHSTESYRPYLRDLFRPTSVRQSTA
ncbi:MAG TPA: phosphoribosyltransferase family protein [Acidimicrobiia bacterium]|nr:phosphoribosyltransferase family protein [Acidimicrobiia bacterium]